MQPRRIVFLCTGNACRSQMAEGWARALWDGRYEIGSAGVMETFLDRRAVEVMAEAGVDIRGQRSKHVDSVGLGEGDLLVSLCDYAASVCPRPAEGVRQLHQPFPDPPSATRDAPSEDKRLAFYRDVRDAIRAFVSGLPTRLERGQEG